MNCLKNLLGNSLILSNETKNELAQSLMDTHDEKFLMLDVEEVVKRYQKWVEKMPRVTPFYAVKCNNHPVVVKTLALLGANFDCASGAEIKQVLSYGVDPSRIIFAQPCKIQKDLKNAAKKNVKMMTFDSKTELYKVKQHHPSGELLIRIRCDDDSAQCNLGVKFGVFPSEAKPLLTLAFSMGLKVVGVAFHVGSGCAEPSVFGRAIADARRVFDEAIEEGHNPHILDIGGGFLSGSYSHLEKAAQFIDEALCCHFPEGSGVRVIAEPGRYMAASCISLFTPIISTRDTALKDERQDKMYFIDDGVYGSFNCILYDHQVVDPVVARRTSTSKALHLSSIWGPTCDGLDQVKENVMLPQLGLGDWVQWDNMGAYTIVAAGKFNGISLPKQMIFSNESNGVFLEQKIQANKAFENNNQNIESKSVSCSPDPIKGMLYGDYIAQALDCLSLPSSRSSSLDRMSLATTSSSANSVYSSLEDVEQ